MNRQLLVGDGTLGVAVRGEGAALLWLHAFPLDSTLWRHQLEAFPGWQGIAPDLRGFGSSRDARVSRDRATLAQYASDAVGVLDALGVGDAVVCGCSMGGYVALEIWRHYAGRVRAMVLMDTRADADGDAARAGRDAMVRVALEEGTAAVADRLLGRLVAPATLASRPEVVAAVRGMIASASPEGIAAALRAMRDRPDSGDLLRHITVPVLVIGGAQDAVIPPQVMRAMAEQMSNARFSEVPGAGHLAPLEQPGVVNAAVARFLAELERRVA